MKFASMTDGKNRDGVPLLVSRDLSKALVLSDRVRSMRELLETWDEHEAFLEKTYTELNAGKIKEAFSLNQESLLSCVPRTFLFADGSAFIHHIKLVRKARNAEPPPSLYTVPLIYQAEGGKFLSPRETIPQRDPNDGTDFEAEVGVFVSDVRRGISPEEAVKKIKLVCLINDVSLRGLIPAELAQGFGFFVSKPTKALSPIAVTPDELGGSWRGGRLHRPLHVDLNGKMFGRANAGEMHFHFGQLIAHAAQTRDLVAGSLIGSGTVANENPNAGSSCLAEKRTIEQIQTGAPITPFMQVGDQVEIWMEDDQGAPIFGKISQKVVKS
jgi:fumarylacetoacetate (FAA) hydrolase